MKSLIRVNAALLLLAGMFVLSQPAGAAAQVAADSGNLLVNPNATAGSVSVQGWDAVTIPGWQVAAGIPTVVRYGTAGFPRAAGAWPASRGRVFAGGAGGTARLVQRVPLLLPSGQAAPAGTRYQTTTAPTRRRPGTTGPSPRTCTCPSPRRSAG